jgi:hypothetical protein
MKKGLLALLLVAVTAFTLGVTAFGAGTGNLVIHFQSLDGEYDNLGNWTWGPLDGKTKLRDGVDSFGAYWTYDDVAVGIEIPFIGVDYVGGSPDWDGASTRGKLTDDIMIPADTLVENKTVHVYIFQGKFGNGNHIVFASDPDAYNMLLVYYDPTGNYEDTLGIHAWSGWTNFTEPGWASPAQVFLDAAQASDGSVVKAAMLSASATGAGLLVYAGSDATKKTGDVKMESALSATPALGDVGVAYVLSKGDAYTVNDNVWYNDNEDFIQQGFSFRLVDFAPGDMTGTYAVNPTTVIVKTSKLVENPYATAETDAEKLAAIETVKNWFAVENGNGEFSAIERVDFARGNNTLDSFVIILDEDDALDNTDDYTVHFDLGYAGTDLAAKEVEVTINLTVPASTPLTAVLTTGGSFQGWNPGSVDNNGTPEDATDDVINPNMDWAATRITDTTFSISFKVPVTSSFTTFEYKWTQGHWGVGENVTGNRPLIIPYSATSIVLNDVITAWDNDSDAADTKYAAPVAMAIPANLSASLELDLDKTAPVLTFISPLSFLGATAANRVITVEWGKPFNQSLFPRFAVADDRDGDITSFVFVPKGANSVLDTRTEGDYTIMLQVTDRWGNVTQETFIFRVVKS